MTRFQAGATFALVTACLALPDSAFAAGEEAQVGGDARACQHSVSELRARVASGNEEAGEGEHRLLGGLSAEEAGAPQENWFGSPPDDEETLDKLDEAGALAGEGDADGCRQLVKEVEEALGGGGSPN